MQTKSKRFPIPRIDGKYVAVYKPQGDIYEGLDTNNFKNGQYYDEWITNDFSVMYKDGVWHLGGITHPRPKSFVNAFDFDHCDVHEAETQLFHATAEGKYFGEVFREGAFTDRKKTLYPSERPGEMPELWAPQLLTKDGKIHIIYSPRVMRHAVTDDFIHWTVLPPLFKRDNPSARDPYIRLIDGIYYFAFTEDDKIYLCTSPDLENWSEPQIICTGFAGSSPESSNLIKRGDVWYLFWSIYDGRNGCYDERTYVFAADTPTGFLNTAPLTMLSAHAPEIILGEDGEDYILSVFYPENGVNAARLIWD